MPDKAVFLDRDGTIARDVHYCRRTADFDLLPTVPEAIRLLNNAGMKVIVVTNQSGIARGYFTEEVLANIHQKMRLELEKGAAHLDDIYYCPHHPDAGCECRKPKTTLFLKAVKKFDIDLAHSFVVGDMEMDIQAGKRLGCQTVLVKTGPTPALRLPEGSDSVTSTPDFVASTLLEAAEWIVHLSSAAQGIRTLAQVPTIRDLEE